MTVETATRASQLNTALPADADDVSEGAAHVRLVKTIVKDLGGGIDITVKDADYTFVITDEGGGFRHTSGSTHTYTIPANASVAFDIGTCLTFFNDNGGGSLSIAITTDTMRLAGAGTTGTRTIAANGVATAIKLSSTSWLIAGTNLS
jgi:hypothetical protein